MFQLREIIPGPTNIEVHGYIEDQFASRITVGYLDRSAEVTILDPTLAEVDAMIAALTKFRLEMFKREPMTHEVGYYDDGVNRSF